MSVKKYILFEKELIFYARKMKEEKMQAEWIILTVIVVLLVSKLISVLGKEPVQGEKVRLVSKNSGQILEMRLIKGKELEKKEKTPLSFNEEDFLMGAKMAFHAVVDAFACGNKEALKPLLSKKVYDAFVSDIEERQKKEEKMEFSLIAIDSSKVLQKSSEQQPTTVTVEFISEQMNVLKNKEGVVLEGDPILITKVLDIWTFEKEPKGRSNWVVTATKSEAFHA